MGLDSLDKNKATTAAAGAATAAVAIATATQLGAMIYEKITGNAYSKADQERLEELKQLYQQTFQLEPPVHWELDEKNRPTYCIKSSKWLPYLRQLKQTKEPTGHYHYPSNQIAEHAVTYLVARGQRWIGAGKPGDIVAQFFGEWVHFAINDLPTFGYDSISINKIKARLQYLEKAQKHENMFKHDPSSRGKNKAAVMECIKNQLKSCIVIASQESLRQSAREKFDCYRNNLTALLLASIQMLYYARLTETSNEPLELESYLSLPDAGPISESTKMLYDSLQETHTGQMLLEIITIVTPSAFGCSKKQINQQREFAYYEPSGEKKTVDWKKLKNDLPKWVESTNETRCLFELQEMGESVIRVAQLKHLIEIAYDLTGKVGDLWAYGDSRGKLSMQALLFLLQEETRLLKDKYDKFYEFHNQRRHQYNLKNHINPNKGSNPNFNKVDEQYTYMIDRNKALCVSIYELRDQLSQYPEDMRKVIDQKKEIFYKSITIYIKKFYPDIYPQYQLLDQCEKNETTLSVHVTPTFQDRPNTSIPILGQDEKIIPLFKPEKNNVGWARLYLLKHRGTFEILKNLKKELQKAYAMPESGDKIFDLSDQIKKLTTQLKNSIKLDLPRWKIKFNPLSVTVGWPFHRKTIQSANQLLTELDQTIEDVEKNMIIFRKNILSTSTATIIMSLTDEKEHTVEYDSNTFLTNKKYFSSHQPCNQNNVNNWFISMYNKITDWEKEKFPVQIFKKEDDPENIIYEILSFLEKMDRNKKYHFMQLWDSYIFLIELSMSNSPDIDAQSRGQFLLVLTINKLIKSTKEDLKKIENSFISQFNDLFFSEKNITSLCNDMTKNKTNSH
jgi:hypothetical protein